MTETEPARSGASFRDPAGFVFERDGGLYRQVNRARAADYDRLIESGLYRDLVDDGLLIAHEEVGVEPLRPAEAHRVLRPERIPFVSYPYEWCFSQLKDAALLTLELQRRALTRDLSLKDASAFNVQFHRGRPVLIDTLSFEAYREGEPWAAYRQFCQHFLAPLALMALRDVRLNQLARSHLDGVPLDLASRLLPWQSRLRPSLLVHLHVHAKLQRGHAATPARARGSFGRRAMIGLIDTLEAGVRGLRWSPTGSEWAEYASENSYSEAARERKRRLVGDFLDRAGPGVAWDLGANTGDYSRLAAERGSTTIALDLDPACVERHYLDLGRRGETRVLPLLMDLTNPSPSVGWQNRERASLLGRGPADVVLALALVHHLAIAHNVPVADLAGFFAKAGRWLVVEFVPKSDPMARRLLAGREDIFPDYHRAGFEEAFWLQFRIHRAEPISDGERVLYLLERRGDG
jgi:ribosomal protein L11 methylase PrmA